MININLGKYDNFEIVDFKFEKGKIEVIKRCKATMMFLTDHPQFTPDRIIKEIYKAENNQIILEKVIEGKHKPAYNVPESFEFGE